LNILLQQVYPYLMTLIKSSLPSQSDLTLAQANHESWFQNKVLASMQDTRPHVGHEKVMSEVEAIIYQAELKSRKLA
jgi:hypothetical protein